MDILQRFLSTCESLTSPSTAFAVHCRSGLGRTATLIGAYAIRHCGFTARAWVKAEFSMFFFVGGVGLSILTIYICIYIVCIWLWCNYDYINMINYDGFWGIKHYRTIYVYAYIYIFIYTFFNVYIYITNPMFRGAIHQLTIPHWDFGSFFRHLKSDVADVS